MDNARKHLFWPTWFQHPYCTICYTNAIDIWIHVLFNCTQPNTHAFQIHRHNKAVWEFRNTLIQSLHQTLYSNECRYLKSKPTQKHHSKLANNMHLPPQDDIVMSNSNPIYYMSKDYHTKPHLQPNQIHDILYNSSNSLTQTTGFLKNAYTKKSIYIAPLF